jgi:hypothetical protein
MSETTPYATIVGVIRTIRGCQVILDADLAALYGVEVKRLNEQVKRNARRFPEDFMFALTDEEAAAVKRLRSQFATLKRGQHRKYLPLAFTEHGAIMAATVLNSPKAEDMSVFIVRAFVRMRRALLARHTMEKRLGQIENVLLVHDGALKDLYEKLRPLLLPPPEPERPKIGFGVREPRAVYRVRRSRSQIATLKNESKRRRTGGSGGPRPTCNPNR